MFVARNAVFLEREYICKGPSGSRVKLEEIQAPQRSIEPIVETEQVLQDVVEPAQVTQGPRKSSRIR